MIKDEGNAHEFECWLISKCVCITPSLYNLKYIQLYSKAILNNLEQEETMLETAENSFLGLLIFEYPQGKQQKLLFGVSIEKTSSRSYIFT